MFNHRLRQKTGTFQDLHSSKIIDQGMPTFAYPGLVSLKLTIFASAQPEEVLTKRGKATSGSASSLKEYIKLKTFTTKSGVVRRV